jgi:hypothetical protein
MAATSGCHHQCHQLLPPLWRPPMPGTGRSGSGRCQDGVDSRRFLTRRAPGPCRRGQWSQPPAPPGPGHPPQTRPCPPCRCTACMQCTGRRTSPVRLTALREPAGGRLHMQRDAVGLMRPPLLHVMGLMSPPLVWFQLVSSALLPHGPPKPPTCRNRWRRKPAGGVRRPLAGRGG